MEEKNKIIHDGLLHSINVESSFGVFFKSQFDNFMLRDM
jgi:hypothetical protein